MDAVEHAVRLERPADLVDDLLARRNRRECQGLGRLDEPVEMLLEPEDAARVQAQPLPDGVAALHDRVERAHARLVAMHEPSLRH